MSGCGLHCLKIQHITVKAGDTLLVDDVSLHAHCGELTAVIGRNGAGKSTLFKAILGEIRHTGTVEFSGPRRPSSHGHPPHRLRAPDPERGQGLPRHRAGYGPVLHLPVSGLSPPPQKGRDRPGIPFFPLRRRRPAGQAGGPPVGGRAAAGAAGRRHPSSARPSDTGRAGFRRGQRRPPAFL